MKTIQTESHLLLIDDSPETKIKDGTTPLWLNDLEIVHHPDWLNFDKSDCSIIIAASPKLGDLPEFETLPPNTENSVEKLALKLYPPIMVKHNLPIVTQNQIAKTIEVDEHLSYRVAFTAGYKQAKSETMFSLEDMKNLFTFTCYQAQNKTMSEFDRFIQDLTKPKQYEFIPEMICSYCFEQGETKYNHKMGCKFKDGSKLIPKIVVEGNKTYIQGIWRLIE